MKHQETSNQVIAIPAFDDNYIWLVHNGHVAIVVDPGDADAVSCHLKNHNLRLLSILVTHHHSDHIGGLMALKEQTGCTVVGPSIGAIDGLTRRVEDGDLVRIPELALSLSAIAVPGHTMDHLAYYSREHDWLFSGDTLFAGGCGRLFEGTADDMHRSLTRLKSLPESTHVFCAHEYTLSNLTFAEAVDPCNPDIMERLEVEQAKRRNGIPTLPTTIELEKRTNPFLRTTNDNIIRSVCERTGKTNTSAVEIFSELRKWKDTFKTTTKISW